MFLDFLFHARAVGLKVTVTEWMTLMEALSQGHARSDLACFYHLARSILIKKESQFDLWDRAFASYFKGIEHTFNLDDELLDWLSNPVLPKELSPEELAKLKSMDLDELRKKFEETLKKQDERHDGGNRWVGTGGTSPYGHGGYHPSGLRIGGPGGGRNAVQVAELRQFRNLRNDRVLDTRQIGVALRRLRKLARDTGPEELSIPKTIDKTARDGGEIDLVFEPPRNNKLKLLLLMDVGGSMDPHSELCERLFSAAHAASHFKKFEAYQFHNCVYENLYTDMMEYRGIMTEDLLNRIDQTWTLVIVGDAWMSPYELTHTGGALYYFHNNAQPGIEWLKRLRNKVPRSVWLNPEPEKFWGSAKSIRLVKDIFPMYQFSVDGLTEAVDYLRGAHSHPMH